MVLTETVIRYQRRAAKALIARRRELGFLVTLVGDFGNWWTIDGKTEFGEKLLDDLRLAGIPDKVRPEDLELPPEHRLSEAELKEMAKSPSRAKGRLPSGIWMRDNYPDGRSVLYWNGTKVGTSTFEIRGDTRYTTGSDGKTSSCVNYRNPEPTPLRWST